MSPTLRCTWIRSDHNFAATTQVRPPHVDPSGVEGSASKAHEIQRFPSDHLTYLRTLRL